jgi:hypothetical protein
MASNNRIVFIQSGNEAVNSRSTSAHPAVNQMEYQESKGCSVEEARMAGYKHFDASPRLLAVDLEHTTCRIVSSTPCTI